MGQNRNKLILLFISNISNFVVHKILEEAIDDDNIRNHYNKELSVSLDIAKRYRNQINPVFVSLPEKDVAEIKSKIVKKVNSELNLRISKGYKNIDLVSVEPIIDNALKETNVSRTTCQ